MKISNKKYNIIYADPPWHYNDKGSWSGAERNYRVMKPLDIAALPVRDIAADDCVLFMWITMPQLPIAFTIIDIWGFEYKTCAFTWVKRNKIADTFFWGMGNWTRANAELCLLAIKGKPKRESARVHSVIYSPIQKHSRKPAETRDRIVELCGDVPRIELFATERVKGWDAWGDEVSKKAKKSK